MEPMRGVDRDKPKAPVPTLMIGINDTAGSIAEPGWPLIVAVVRVAADKAPAIPLPANLRLKVSRADGTEVLVNFVPVPPTVNDPAANRLHWLAAEATTTALSPGRYLITGTAGAGWQIESGEFQVVAPNPERSSLLGHLQIRRSVLLGQTEAALAQAERMTIANAGDRAAWTAKGDLLMMQDKPDEAVLAYDRALSLQNKADREPVALLLRRRNASLRSLEQRGVIPDQKREP